MKGNARVLTPADRTELDTVDLLQRGLSWSRNHVLRAHPENHRGDGQDTAEPGVSKNACGASRAWCHRGEINRFPPKFFPSHIDFAGYRALFAESGMVIWLVNSTIVTIIAVVSHLALCSLAGYGFARLRFLGRDMAFFAIVGTIMIPIQLLMIPTFAMFSRLGLINTLGAAFVPWLTSAFGIFLMRQFFLALRVELEDAARIDGCNRLQVFWRIVLPLARPALATLAVFTLLGAWNDLIWPLIAISDERW